MDIEVFSVLSSLKKAKYQATLLRYKLLLLVIVMIAVIIILSPGLFLMVIL
jgi:hypothetical protein